MSAVKFLVACSSQFRLGPILESITVIAVSRWVLGQIFLVLRVGLVKGGVIDNLRFHLLLLVRLDGFRINVPLELGLDRLGDCFLLGRRTKDDAPVLGSTVVPLSVQRGRVVKGVKEAHHFLKDFRRRRGLLGEFDVQNLDVASGSTTDLAVGRILHAVRVGIHKADLCIGDASGMLFLKILDNVFFGTPVAAAAIASIGIGRCKTKGTKIVSMCCCLVLRDKDSSIASTVVTAYPAPSASVDAIGAMFFSVCTLLVVVVAGFEAVDFAFDLLLVDPIPVFQLCILYFLNLWEGKRSFLK